MQQTATTRATVKIEENEQDYNNCISRQASEIVVYENNNNNIGEDYKSSLENLLERCGDSSIAISNSNSSSKYNNCKNLKRRRKTSAVGANMQSLSTSLSSSATTTTVAASTTTTTTATTTTTTGGGSLISNCCAGCRAPIRDKFIFSVIDLQWHQDCVQCSDCGQKLKERCYTFEGKLYCKLDYWHRFGPKCFACRESIERSELVQRIKGNRVYHLKCFTCSQCQRQLKAGEQLHLIDGKRLLCKQDYHHQFASAPLGSGGGGGGGSATTNDTLTSKVPAESGNCKGSSARTTSNGFGSGGGGGGGGGATDSQQTYYMLMSSQQQQHQVVSGADKANHLAKQAESDDEGALEDGLEEELDDDADDDDEMDEDMDDLDELDGDEFELRELGQTELPGQATRNGERNHGQRRRFAMLGYLDSNDNNNVENDENNQLGGANMLADSNQAPARHLKRAGKHQQGQQLANGHSLDASATKRRRRRKQRIGQPQESPMSGSIGGGQATNGKSVKLANRNGESILNGSILASVHSGASGQLSSSGASIHHHHLQQQLVGSANSSNTTLASNQKSVSSSAASTASNSSTGSSVSHQHHHQQQQQQQQQRTTTNGNTGEHHSNQQHNHHHHHNSSSGHKPTRVRTVLNEKQLQTLRDCYAHNPRPDALMKEQLVDLTGLSPRVIRVWFQNKRCKDKKKSILYKQMQQHEKDGRHLAGLTLMRGVPLVASSPIQYDDHSTVSSTPTGQQSQPQSQSQHSPGQPDQARHNSSSTTTGYAHSSPENPQQQPMDIHAYQPPWKSLAEYAHQQAANQPGNTPPERPLNSASPRYQQLMGQIHGYGATVSNEQHHHQQQQQLDQQQTGVVVELQPQQFGQANLSPNTHLQANYSAPGTQPMIGNPAADQQAQQLAQHHQLGLGQPTAQQMNHLHQQFHNR